MAQLQISTCILVVYHFKGRAIKYPLQQTKLRIPVSDQSIQAAINATNFWIYLYHGFIFPHKLFQLKSVLPKLRFDKQDNGWCSSFAIGLSRALREHNATPHSQYDVQTATSFVRLPTQNVCAEINAANLTYSIRPTKLLAVCFVGQPRRHEVIPCPEEGEGGQCLPGTHRSSCLNSARWLMP